VYKLAASVAYLACDCILLHAYSHTATAPSCASTSKNFIACLKNWYNSVFHYKLHTSFLSPVSPSK